MSGCNTEGKRLWETRAGNRVCGQTRAVKTHTTQIRACCLSKTQFRVELEAPQINAWVLARVYRENVNADRYNATIRKICRLYSILQSIVHLTFYCTIRDTWTFVWEENPPKFMYCVVALVLPRMFFTACFKSEQPHVS